MLSGLDLKDPLTWEALMTAMLDFKLKCPYFFQLPINDVAKGIIETLGGIRTKLDIEHKKKKWMQEHQIERNDAFLKQAAANY